MRGILSSDLFARLRPLRLRWLPPPSVVRFVATNFGGLAEAKSEGGRRVRRKLCIGGLASDFWLLLHRLLLSFYSLLPTAYGPLSCLASGHFFPTDKRLYISPHIQVTVFEPPRLPLFGGYYP